VAVAHLLHGEQIRLSKSDLLMDDYGFLMAERIQRFVYSPVKWLEDIYGAWW
jgi:hypothetical protein